VPPSLQCVQLTPHERGEHDVDEGEDVGPRDAVGRDADLALSVFTREADILINVSVGIQIVLSRGLS
jgi:hypothetical protein